MADIIRVGGRNNTNETVSLALKDSTTICGRHTRRTAIKEIFMLVIMSTASSAELALDEDLALVLYSMCQQAREIHIGKLQQLVQGADHIFEDKQGRPTLSCVLGKASTCLLALKSPPSSGPAPNAVRSSPSLRQVRSFSRSP